MSSFMENIVYGEEWNGRPLESLTKEHIINIIKSLQDRVDILKRSYEFWLLAAPEPTSEAAMDCYNSGFDETLRQSAEDWLEETELMVNLRKLLKERSNG